MFSKLSIVVALALLAVATPTPCETPSNPPAGSPTPPGETPTGPPTGPPSGVPGDAPPASQCNTAPVQCCNSVQNAGSPDVAAALALLGITLQDLNIPIGLNCVPISVVGVGSGASCDAHPVCCTDNNFEGVVAIGCTIVNIDL